MNDSGKLIKRSSSSRHPSEQKRNSNYSSICNFIGCSKCPPFASPALSCSPETPLLLPFSRPFLSSSHPFPPFPFLSSCSQCFTIPCPLITALVMLPTPPCLMAIILTGPLVASTPPSLPQPPATWKIAMALCAYVPIPMPPN